MRARPQRLLGRIDQAVKDRLYCEPSAAPSRRGAQAVLWASLLSLTTGLAPLAPHAAQDVADAAGVDIPGAAAALFGVAPTAPPPASAASSASAAEAAAEAEAEAGCRGSVFRMGWPLIPAAWRDDALAEEWVALRELKSEVSELGSDDLAD